ncbi:hypothetical protein AB0N79_39170, partial [Streptomyces microflavus]
MRHPTALSGSARPPSPPAPAHERPAPARGRLNPGHQHQAALDAAILTGAKTIENRPQHWSWRTWALLHAGQQTDRPALRLLLVARTIGDRQLVTGAVVG